MTSRRGRLLAACGGIVCALGCPPVGAWPLVLVGLAALGAAVAAADGVREAALRGLAWAWCGQLVVLSFVVATVERFSGVGLPGGVLALVLLAGAQSLGLAIGAGASWWIAARTALPWPLALACGTTIAWLAPALFGWTPATLVAVRPELVQGAEVVGRAGVSFVLVGLCGGAGVAVLRRGRRQATLACLGVLLALVGIDRLGAWRMSAVDARVGDRLVVALVSHDAPARRDPDAVPGAVALRRLLALSRRADRAQPDLVVWPEAAYPFALEHSARAIGGGSASPVAGARAPRLIGLTTQATGPAGTRRALYNSAALFAADGSTQRPYDKVKLIPFGEALPFGALRSLFPRASRTTAGASHAPLVLPAADGRPPVRLGILICYEDTDGGVGRATARHRPRLLVNLTNDAWFSGTSGPDLQLLLSRMRTVETRTALVRAVNAGPSAWVDAAGRLRASRAGDRPGVLIVRPVLRAAGASPTFYVRHGDLPLVALVVVLVGGGVVSRRRPWRHTQAKE